MSNRMDSLHVVALTAQSFTPPAASIGSAAINPGSPVDVDRQRHRVYKVQSFNSTPTAQTVFCHAAMADGTVELVHAGQVAINSSGSVTVDLRKNGTTILSAPIVLDSGNTNRVMEAGTVSSAAYVAGDFFEWVVTVSTPNGTGLALQAVFNELPT